MTWIVFSGSGRGTAAGFTLVEMVVATAMMSLIGVLIFTSMRFAQRTHAQVDRAEASLAEMVSSQRVLRNLIESAYPFVPDGNRSGSPKGLQGDNRSIAFSAAGALSGGAAGLQRYSVVLRRRENSASQDVVLSWWPDRNGQPASEQAVGEEVLVADVEAIDWSYLMSASGDLSRDEKSSGGALFSEPNWLDEWRERDRLPEAVRVRIRYANNDSRANGGGWPELVIKPRITDDANCEFDVVGQDCRRVY